MVSRGLHKHFAFISSWLQIRAIPHNSKCRYGERGAADAKPKAQIILDAAKVSAASGGNSEPKQGQRSQSARGFCPRSTMRVPQPDIIEHFGNADAVPQLPERCLSRKAGIMRYCLRTIIKEMPKNKTSSLFCRPEVCMLLFCFSFVIVLRLPLRFFNQLAGVGKAEVCNFIAGDHAG